MIKNIAAGIFIGIANIIPGISGGTIIVMLGMFDKIMFAISDVFKKDAFNRKENIIFLFQIVIGLLIGLITFANLIDLLFNNWPTQTIFCFLGFILFSVPYIIKKEMNKISISPLFLGLGFVIILSLVLLDNNSSSNIITAFPIVTLPHLLKMFVLGIITAMATIFPGISGAMILLILGEYHLYKTYIAKVLTFNPEVTIPIAFIAIGIIIGIIFSAKITAWLLTHYRRQTMSIILGLIIMSSLILIPLNVEFDGLLILSSIVWFLFGGLVITTIEKSKG